jgi:hypothetical protein
VPGGKVSRKNACPRNASTQKEIAFLLVGRRKVRDSSAKLDEEEFCVLDTAKILSVAGV